MPKLKGYEGENNGGEEKIYFLIKRNITFANTTEKLDFRKRKHFSSIIMPMVPLMNKSSVHSR